MRSMSHKFAGIELAPAALRRTMLQRCTIIVSQIRSINRAREARSYG